MNIEELKLVIELIQSLSGDATTALIWWMVFDVFKQAIGFGALIGVVWLVVKGISGTSDWANAGKAVARAYGGEGSNPYFYKEDRRAIDSAIEKAKVKP